MIQTIFEFLTLKELFSFSGTCTLAYRATLDDGVWDCHFPNQKRLEELRHKYDSGPSTVTMREVYVHEMKVISNLTSKKRYQNYNLVGHNDQLTALDASNGVIVSGSRDTSVKIWDVEKKRGWTFEGRHRNMITKVVLWDQFSALSASIDRTIRHFDVRDWPDNLDTKNAPEVETLNGYQYSKVFMGHTRPITQL